MSDAIRDREFRMALRDALERLYPARGPLTAKELHKALPRPFQRAVEEIAETLDRLVGENHLQKITKRGVTRYLIAGAPGDPPYNGPSSFKEIGRGVKRDLDDEDLVLREVRAMAAAEPPGSLLSISDLRGRLRLSKPRFDRATLELARRGRVYLHHHDFPQSLPPAAREKLVKDTNGVHYVGTALPQPGRGEAPAKVASLGATQIIEAAHRLLEKRDPRQVFGDNKVFISALWKEIGARFYGRPDEFKARLVDLHRAREISLSRADLVEAMDARAVAESETRYLSQDFHFVRV